MKKIDLKTTIVKESKERNWVFATKSDFLIPIPLQPRVVDQDILYSPFCKIKLFKFEISKVVNHQVSKIQGFENLSLWQKFSSFQM